MAKKMTKIETINAIITKYGISGEDKEFLDHEVELIRSHYANRSDKPTKKQVENAGIKETLVSLLEVGKTYTATDLTEALGVADMKVQRVSALLKQLVDEGKVVRGIIKRRAYFGLPGTEFAAPTAEDAE